MRARFGGFGATIGGVGDEGVDLGEPSAGLNRRSKPIVVDGFELIAFPHKDPAT